MPDKADSLAEEYDRSSGDTSEILPNNNGKVQGTTPTALSGGGLPPVWSAFLRERHAAASGVFGRCKELPNGCWEWLGGTSSTGYGAIGVAGVQMRVHRLVYVIFNGPIQPWVSVCHSCDNRKCINPKHLTIGTDETNALDMAAKGRAHLLRYTEADVREVLRLRSTGLGYKSIARKTGMSKGNVKNICSGKTWRHIEREGANRGS